MKWIQQFNSPRNSVVGSFHTSVSTKETLLPPGLEISQNYTTSCFIPCDASGC